MAKKTKITTPRIKKSPHKSYKSIIFAVFVALVMLGGYASYKNLAKPASINVADGLEAEEAAYIQKATVKSNQAPAPVVKVTVKGPDGQDHTSAVILNKTEKKNDQGETVSIADQIKTEVIAKGIITDEKGVVVGGGSLNQPSASTDPLVTAPGAVGGTCSVNGANLPSNKFVPTGYGVTTDQDGKTTRCTAAGCAQRECVLLNSDCTHGEVIACDVAYARDPSSVVFPTNAGKEYTGNGPSYKNNCFDKSGTTHLSGSLEGGDLCYDGKWVSKDAADFDEKMALGCKTGQTYDKVKNACQDGPTAQQITEQVKAQQASDAAKNSHVKVCQASGFATWNATTNSCEGAKSDINIKYRTNYSTKDKCTTAAGDDTCIPVQGGGFAIVPKNSSIKSVSYNTGTTAGRPTSLTNNSYKDIDTCKLAVRGGEKCEPIPGSGTTAGAGGYRIVTDNSPEAIAERNKGIFNPLKYEFGKSSASTTVSSPSIGSNQPINTPTGTVTNISDNSAEKVFSVGEKCGGAETSVFFGLVTLANECQRKCEGGVYTTIKSDSSLIKTLVCGESTDALVLSTVNAISLTETNVQIVKDSSSELTSKLYSECSNSFGSDNLCSRCEGGVVTTINFEDNKKSYCGDISGVQSNLGITVSNNALSGEDYRQTYPGYIQDSPVASADTRALYPGNSVPVNNNRPVSSQVSTIAQGGAAGAALCAGTLAVAGLWTASAAWYFIPACALIGAGTGVAVNEYVTNPPASSPNSTRTTTPQTPTTNYVVDKDYTLEQTLKPGDDCSSKYNCQTKCKDSVLTTYTLNSNSKKYMCGDESFVTTALEEKKLSGYSVIGDNTAEHTLKAGQVCGNWLSAKECRDKCPGGYTAVDTKQEWDYGGFRYVCGGADVLADPTTPSTVLPTASPVSTEPELVLTAKEKEAKVHIENLQIKIDKILEVDPHAFDYKDYANQSSCAPTCVPIPDGSGRYLKEQDIIDATKRLNIGLND